MTPPPTINSVAVDEDPSTFLPANTGDSDNNNNGIQITDDDSSLSTATSLTSIVTSHTPHTLRTGVDTAGAPSPFRDPDATTDNNQVNTTPNNNAAFTPRARSMSVPNAVILNPSSSIEVRTSSATRSNPRTRTPMRHASPLLVTGRYLFANANHVGNDVGANANQGTLGDGRRGVRGGGAQAEEGIPEEVEEGMGECLAWG